GGTMSSAHACDTTIRAVRTFPDEPSSNITHVFACSIGRYVAVDQRKLVNTNARVSAGDGVISSAEAVTIDLGQWLLAGQRRCGVLCFHGVRHRTELGPRE